MFDNKKLLSPLMDWRLWVPPSVMSISLVLVAQFSFLTFHTLAELLAIVISFIMFAFAVSTHQFSRNYFVLLLACGYFWIGSLDLMHTLVYKGMNVIVEGTGNLSVQFWIGTRYLEAGLLLMAPLVIRIRLNYFFVFCFFGAGATILASLIFLGFFPTLFVEGEGLTDLKIYSEYIIDLMLAFALVIIFRYGENIPYEEKVLIAASILFTMAAELAFTFYVSVFGFSNLVGHIFKLFSFWFIFQAVVISNLKKPFSELQRLKDYNRNLFDTSPVGLALCRLDGTFVDVNPAFSNIVGRTVAEVLGLNYWQVTPQEYLQQERAQLDKLTTTGMYNSYRKEFLHRDGHRVPVELSGKIIEQDGERFIWAAVSDTTERNNLEEQVRRAQKMEAVGLLTGGIAHDFNNILGIIMGNLELLEDRLTNDKSALKIVANAMKGTERGAEITRKLLGFSRKKSSQNKRVSVNQFIQETEDLLKRSLTVAVDIRLKLADDLWPVDVDPGDFQDAIVNLAINARDAMPEGGQLCIETENKVIDESYARLKLAGQAGEFVMITLTDTGVGMSEEAIGKIFEPFYTTKERGKGTGLGLSMVYGFVQRSGGYLKVYSVVGKGATFRLFLPRTHSSDLASGYVEDLNEQLKLPGGSEKILLVDDEAALRDIARSHLEILGYEVLSAESGKQALQILEKNKDIDLILSDVVMPGVIDGYQLALETRKLYPEIQFMLTSGFVDIHDNSEDEQNEFMAKLVAGTLRKPYNKYELASSVRQKLDQKS